MDLDRIIKSLSYAPKLWLALTYPLLLAIMLVLFFGRNFETLRFDLILLIWPDFYNHISNFSISFITYSTMGYVGLMFDLTWMRLIIVAILLLILTLAFEIISTFINTPDISDAIYGILGVVLGFVFLVLAKCFGLKKNQM